MAGREVSAAGTLEDPEAYAEVMLELFDWCRRHGRNFRGELGGLALSLMGATSMALVWNEERNGQLVVHAARSTRYGFQRAALFWRVRPRVVAGNAGQAWSLTADSGLKGDGWSEKHATLAAAQAAAQRYEDAIVEAQAERVAAKAERGEQAGEPSGAAPSLPAAGLTVCDGPLPPCVLPRQMRYAPVLEAASALKPGQWFIWPAAPRVGAAKVVAAWEKSLGFALMCRTTVKGVVVARPAA